MKSSHNLVSLTLVRDKISSLKFRSMSFISEACSLEVERKVEIAEVRHLSQAQ